MEIKQALLPVEIERVKAFLAGVGLSFDDRAEETLYLEEDEKMIGTVSRAGSLLECLAVDPAHQGENLAAVLVQAMRERMFEAGITHTLVFTKAVYSPQFAEMNFRLLASTDKVALLETGAGSIEEALAGLKKRIQGKWPGILPPDSGAIVVNCNPITLGHLGLIEYAAARHPRLYVFVVEENRSLFTFEERFSLVYLATGALENVLVLPSTPYIVSQVTFPGYFLKSMDEKEEEHAKLDAVLFKNRFMSELGIAKRYLGTETEAFMVRYNDILQKALGETVEIIPRFTQDGTRISASVVRGLLLEGRTEAALSLVPPATRAMLSQIGKVLHERLPR